MKKVIELALKSGEITLKDIMNLVNCIDEDQQERAVMLLIESYDIPDDVVISQKGLDLNRDGKPHRYYTCVGYNYLRNKVIVKENMKEMIMSLLPMLLLMLEKNIDKTILSNNKKSVKSMLDNNKNNNNMNKSIFWGIIFIVLLIVVSILLY